jgi:hypothetical protein
MDVYEELDTIFILTETFNTYFIGLHNGYIWLVEKTVLSRLTIMRRFEQYSSDSYLLASVPAVS